MTILNLFRVKLAEWLLSDLDEKDYEWLYPETKTENSPLDYYAEDVKSGKSFTIFHKELPDHLRSEFYQKIVNFPALNQRVHELTSNQSTTSGRRGFEQSDIFMLNNIGYWLQATGIEGYDENGNPVVKPVLGDKVRAEANIVMKKIIKRFDTEIDIRNGTI